MESGTWHFGLIARWWAEFNVASPEELAFYRAAIKRFGEPVLDLGCGTGRFLVPLLEEGFDVDGSDVSADMIAYAREAAAGIGLQPRLSVQPMHELEAERRYRTVIMCGSLGIGGSPDHDREALRRAYQCLAAGGALLITDHEPPSGNPQPGEWPAGGRHRRTADGDEIELYGRLAAVDAHGQLLTREMRARLWRDGRVVAEEEGKLSEFLHPVAEMLSMLRDAGFRDIAVTANYSDRPATAGDEMVTFTAVKA